MFNHTALEDLPISNLLRNHHLSKSILDAGWGYFRQQLVRSKAEYAGKPVVVVPPAYTSKTFSQRGHVFESLTLAEHCVECDCGSSLDRDHHAALNLLALRPRAWGVT